MFTISERTIAAEGAKSLCWRDDVLLDVLRGAAYLPDGSVADIPWRVYSRFDSVAISPSGRHIVIYERLGTKGLVVDIDGLEVWRPRAVREIDRSCDNADAFDYPLLPFGLRDGREVIAHCPTEPNRLVIEDLVTGTPVAASSGGPSPDFDYYYSHLAANPSGTRIIGTGWFWHPVTEIVLYDVQGVLDDPQKLDRRDAILPVPTEANSAAFVGDDMAMITGSLDPEYTEDGAWLPAGGIALYDITNRRCISSAHLHRPLGNLMPLNSRLVVEFYEHPKLIDIETAEILHTWDDIDSGKQESSIIWHIPPPPPIALDPAHGRFAVAEPSSIRVIEISVP